MATIHQIIAAVNPDLYYDFGGDKTKLNNFKQSVKEKGPYKAVTDILDSGGEVKSKPIILDEKGKMSKEGIEAKHKLVYDSSSETLEPIYFFILDLMNDFGLSPEKITDNFTSSPGSGHFSELGQRATIMQQQATKILGDINNVTRSILNLTYDLKEFKIRLATYDDLKSKNSDTQEAALLSLKQIWMDKVDINKGNSSIKAMALGQVGSQTLIDAFFFVKDEKQAETVDLNDRIKRIIKQRINEFNLWLRESERELKKRYEIERKYLKSQVNSVKLYSRWAKPYMKAAQQLEMKDNSKNPSLIKTFNTILLELSLLGKSKLNPKTAVEEEKIPEEFKDMKLKRNYYSCILIEFNFRGIPQKTSAYQQNYVFGGRSEVTFTAYSLNDDELKLIREELEKSDVGDAFKLIEGSTTGSLEELQKDIDMFLNEEEETEKKIEQTIQKDMSNPILALLGSYNPKRENVKVSASKNNSNKKLRPDDYLEKSYLRPAVSKDAVETAFTLFDIYKKAHGMPSYT